MNRRGFLRRIGAIVAAAPVLAVTGAATLPQDVIGASNTVSPDLKLTGAANNRTIVGSSNIAIGNVAGDAITVLGASTFSSTATTFSAVDKIRVTGNTTLTGRALVTINGSRHYIPIRQTGS